MQATYLDFQNLFGTKHIRGENTIGLLVSDKQPQPPQPKTIGKPPIPEVNSEELMRGHTELLIHHEGETYRLKLTRNGKLILHK